MKQRILTLHLKHIYWHVIQRGFKFVEYRRFNSYWIKRILDRKYDLIKLCSGYPKANDKSKIMFRKWKGYHTSYIKHPEFGNKHVKVFVIDVSRTVTEGHS